MNLISAKVSPTVRLWKYNTAGIAEIKTLHFPRPKAQSLVLWGAQRYVTYREDFMSKDNQCFMEIPRIKCLSEMW